MKQPQLSLNIYIHSNHFPSNSSQRAKPYAASNIFFAKLVMLKIKHCIVGAGPVGLTLGHFFKKFNFPFLILEKKSRFSAHPSAHYINMRSMEILYQLGVTLPLEDIHHFRNYAYVTRIGDDPLWLTNQLVNTSAYSLDGIAHLPQNEMVNCLSSGLEKQVRFDSEVVGIQTLGSTIAVTLKNAGHIECEYLYGCDGLNGSIRDLLGIQLEGQRNIQRFLNVHFESKQLVRMIQKYNSMLTFVYNSDILAVLIKHQIKTGTFAIQIPLDLIVLDPNAVDASSLPSNSSIKDLIQKTLVQEVRDIEIKSVGLWQMGAVVASQYFKGNCILVGDACHAMPPAGGFGMNTGIQDAHNLAYKMLNKDKLIDYEVERKQIAWDNIRTAMKYYQKSIEIAEKLGYSYRDLKVCQQVMKMTPSFVQQYYRDILKIGSSVIEASLKLKELKNIQKDGIPLVFPEEEIDFKYKQGNFDFTNPHPLVGKLCPLEIRKKIRGEDRNTWYAVNREIPQGSPYEFTKIVMPESNLKLVVRNDEQVYSVDEF